MSTVHSTCCSANEVEQTCSRAVTGSSKCRWPITKRSRGRQNDGKTKKDLNGYLSLRHDMTSGQTTGDGNRMRAQTSPSPTHFCPSRYPRNWRRRFSHLLSCNGFSYHQTPRSNVVQVESTTTKYSFQYPSERNANLEKKNPLIIYAVELSSQVRQIRNAFYPAWLSSF